MDINSSTISMDSVLQENSSDRLSRTIPEFEILASNNNPVHKKRKLSTESISNPSDEQYIIQDISQSGNFQYDYNLTNAPSEFIDASTQVRRTFGKKDLKTLRIQIAMISDPDGDRPIHVAVAQENVKLVKKLCALMLKATISLDLTNYLRQTPLHLAVMLGNVQLVSLLLKCRACVTMRDRRGRSVLHLALLKGECVREVLQLLMSRPDIERVLDALDYEGYSALHYAIVRDNKAAIRYFYEKGAQMNITDGKSGRSPLIHAVLDQNVKMVELLLDCGAAPEIADYSGRTALDYALYTTNKHIIKTVERKICPPDAVPQVRTADSKQTAVSTPSCSVRNRSERIAARSSKKMCVRDKTDTL